MFQLVIYPAQPPSERGLAGAYLRADLLVPDRQHAEGVVGGAQILLGVEETDVADGGEAGFGGGCGWVVLAGFGGGCGWVASEKVCEYSTPSTPIPYRSP